MDLLIKGSPELNKMFMALQRTATGLRHDFGEVEKQYNYFFDKLQGSKFDDIEREAVAMTTCYFMEKRFRNEKN